MLCQWQGVFEDNQGQTASAKTDAPTADNNNNNIGGRGTARDAGGGGGVGRAEVRERRVTGR